MSEENVKIFEDTQKLYSTDQYLVNSIKESLSRQVLEKGTVDLYVSEPFDHTNIVVSTKRSIEAARAYAINGQKTCVLNFASATNPGGGVLKGSSTQEEAICRVSTLYPCIYRELDSFYKTHINELIKGSMNNTYNSDCIYTPDITVFKSDTNPPKLLDRSNWYAVDMVTCAAPNLRPPRRGKQDKNSVILKQSELLDIHMERGRKILNLAANNGCEVVILGAFGCGAFKNSPNVVAEAYRRLMNDFAGIFETVEFAVYCNKQDTDNYTTFNRVLCGGKSNKIVTKR